MNKEIEKLNKKEIVLLNEMKRNCLNGDKYKDENAKDKFYLLCHLEDFVIKCDDLQQENKQLKERIDFITKYVESRITICKETYLDSNESWNEDFIGEVIARKYAYEDILEILKGE